MSGLPNTRFYLDDGTGTFPEDVTGLVKLEDGYQFTRGRGDVQSAPSAGTMNLTFNNGRPGFIGAFTPGSTVLRSPSVIALDTRIRVKEIVNGSTYNRYTGYVKSWAVGWPDGVENTGVVRINCSDAQARAERRVLRSVVAEETFLDSPTGYFVGNEPAGSTSLFDTSGSQLTALTLGGDGTGSATFGGASSGLPSIPDTTSVSLAGNIFIKGTASTAPGTVRVWVKTSQASGTLFKLGSDAITFDSVGGGRILVNGNPFSQPINDGSWHQVMMPAANPINVDGNNGAVNCPTWGTGAFSIAGDYAVSGTFTGSVAQIAFFASALSSTRTDAHHTAGATGFAGETDNARLTRLAGYANIPVGTLDTSLTNVPYTDFTGRTAWDCIQEVADASMGVAYIDGSGNLVFHNRQKVTVKTTPDLTLNASFVTFDTEPTTDDQDLLNYMEVTASATGNPQLARDTVSESGDATHPAHGRYSDSKELLLSTDGEALDRANWLVKTRAQPSSAGRYGTLTVNLYGMTAAQQSSAVSALEPGCWLRIVNMPTQTPGGTTVDLAVEGIAPSQSGNNWTIQCNVVSKSTLYPKVFILDSSLLDGPDLLGV